MEQHVMHQTASTKTLLKTSLAAFVVALGVLTAFVLPAEYGIDPTGIGKALGLTVLANVENASQTSASDVSKRNANEDVNQTIEVVVPAGFGIEYKFEMPQYAKLIYDWSTTGELLSFDLHGEPAGDTTGYYESYVVATSNQMKGSFTTPFAGSHGWYWENNTTQNITVTLTFHGEYTSMGFK